MPYHLDHLLAERRLDLREQEDLQMTRFQNSGLQRQFFCDDLTLHPLFHWRLDLELW